MCVYFARDFRHAAPFYIVRNIDWTGGHVEYNCLRFDGFM